MSSFITCTSIHVQVNSPIRSTTNRIWIVCCQLESILTASLLYERQDCYFEQRGFVRVKLCIDWRFPILQNMALKHSVGSGRSHRRHQNQYNKLCDRTDIKRIKHMPVWMWMLWIFLHSPVVPVTFMDPGMQIMRFIRAHIRETLFTRKTDVWVLHVYIINTSILVTVWC